MGASATSLFQQAFGREPAVCARAPGRVEFIGNHTDYNGGLVLGAAIDRTITAVAAPREDSTVRLKSGPGGALAQFDLRTHTVSAAGGAQAWTRYPLGTRQVLAENGFLPEAAGFDLLVLSDLPSGAGLSSSAALEVATAVALSAALPGVSAPPKDRLAQLCREAENRFAGVPCGILDQGTSAFGAADHLVRIDCHTDSFSTVPMPAGVRLWVFESGVKHSLVDSLYATRRQECEAAFAILRRSHPGVACLAHLSPDDVRAAEGDLLPETFRRALHVCGESARVRAMETALAAGDLAEAGRLLVASHGSSRDLFENSTPELDFLVETLAATESVYGARLTGGGFGGAVMAMTGEAFGETQARQVAEAYAGHFGQPCPFHAFRVSDGAHLCPAS